MDEFWDEYDEIAHEVAGSQHRLFAHNLSRWLAAIESHPVAGPMIAGLELRADLGAWYEECRKTVGSMVGSGQLQFPSDQRERLALQMALFRAFATDRIKPLSFARDFLSSPNDHNAMIAALGDQIFTPMARELRRYLSRAVRQSQSDHAPTAPASDRTVSLDHNSAAYQDVTAALEKVERTIQEANDYGDPEDKEQRIAEVSAARRLLQSTKVRLGAFLAITGPLLAYLAKKFVDSSIGKAAGAAWDSIGHLFGIF